MPRINIQRKPKFGSIIYVRINNCLVLAKILATHMGADRLEVEILGSENSFWVQGEDCFETVEYHFTSD